ncbi:hypothetical protein [Candidatus Burkholderia verschuerenii]|nr:hypothetical protein [Candidatus Burkholderia verschuerenii]
MNSVATYSYTHSVTYVTDNLLRSLKDIIVNSGLGFAPILPDTVSHLS